MSEDIRSVLKAMVEVMRSIKDVRKEGYNKDGKYGFVYFADVVAAIQDASIAQGLLTEQREISRVVMGKTLFIKYEMDVYHAETGQFIQRVCCGTGACRIRVQERYVRR